MELPLADSPTMVSFFPDDTIDTIRQQIALIKSTHPDRLFIQVKMELPQNYYSSNPKRWMDLFFRLSYGGNVIKKDALDAYVSQVRIGTGVSPRDVRLEDWRSVEDYVRPLFEPEGDFTEFRILGVSEEKSMILPIPPKDLQLKEAFRPVPARQRLFDTLHRETAVEFSAIELDESTSDAMKQVYFPFFQSTTPANVESLRIPLSVNHNKLKALLDLKAPEPTHTAILKAKWYIPFIGTKFTAPRNRFEQMFYGLTVSKETPVVSFFTSKGETTRHKFYVEDPKAKKPLLDLPMWKGWTSNTQPQRRLPTLLFYRGKSRVSFDRIAVTNKDITISTYRSKDSKDTLETLQRTTLEWMQTLDAVMPFVDQADIDPSRWVLNDLSVITSYAKEISEFDMRRFGCIQSVFSFQEDAFRLLRADRETDVPSEVIRAYAILQAGDSLEKEMGVTAAEAQELTDKVRDLETDENFNLEKANSGYPKVIFSSKDVMIEFVANLERTVTYANILRYVLTSNTKEVNEVCPPRMETVEASAGVAPVTTLEIEDEFDMSEFAEFAEEAEAPPEGSNAAAAPAAGPKVMKVKKGGPLGTHNYFNNRILQIDPNLVDSEYSKKCEKLTQVVILTPAQQARLDPKYKAPANETMKVEKGLAICPQYWCMRDEIPLSEDQLVNGECPECGGKVRVTEKEDPREFTVIKRKGDFKYPDFKDPSDKSSSKKKVPCCYRKPAGSSEVLAPKTAVDEYYVLASGTIPSLRIAYLSQELTKRISLKTNYAKTCPKNRLEASMNDMFRIGLGLPRESLPALLNDKRRIPSPAEAADKIIQCSFFRSWREVGEGDDAIARITAGIDRAWNEKTLSAIDEIEYVALILDCRVLQIHTETNTVSCGFWSDKTSARSRTIALLDTDILGKVTRRKGNVGSKFDYVVDINKFEDAAKNALQALHMSACTTTVPSVIDAQLELAAKGVANYQFILDPFKRVQALFVPQEVVLPVHPISMDIPEGGHVRSGYSDILDEELPTSKTLADFLKTTRHEGFKQTGLLFSADGFYTEFMLASGFRALFRPEESEDEEVATEVLKTIREPHTEEELVSAPPNRADLKLASDVSYSSEVFEFMLFSISKDIQSADHDDLREAIKNPGEDLLKALKKWLNSEAHWDTVNEPVRFVNKVRTPCGQMEENSCKKSTLCGWHENTCKIKVKPIVDKQKLLARLAKTLKENSKQRALVLDGSLSPFFSTVLYLEMPHELITTSP
jgi:hypothetical protein